MTERLSPGHALPETAPAVLERFCKFVRPDHPILGDIFREPPPGMDRLASSVADLTRRTRYVSGPPGFRSLDDLHALVRQAGSAVVPMNCIHRACILVSQLRAQGWSDADVLVATGVDRRDKWLVETVHAWIAVRLPGLTLWIDSTDLVPRESDPDEIQRAYALSVLFNDRRAFVTRDQQRRALEATGPVPPRICIYGDASLDLMRLVQNPGFASLLAPLFAGMPGDTARAEDAIVLEAARLDVIALDGRQYSGGRQLTTVPADAERDLRGLLAEPLTAYAGIFAEWVPRLREAFLAGRAAAEFTWADVAHTIVAGMTADIGVGRALALHEIAVTHHGRRVVWAFERISAKNPFGVIWMRGSTERRGVVQLWHGDVMRAPLRMAPAAVIALERIADGSPERADPKQVMYLRHLGLLRAGAGPPRPTIPVFVPEDADRLGAVIRGACRELVARAITPALAAIFDCGWWRDRAGDERARLAAMRLLLEYGTDGLINAGLLPRFPAGPAVPFAWGRWLWLEPDGVEAAVGPPTFVR
jgi:hypothetical protein